MVYLDYVCSAYWFCNSGRNIPLLENMTKEYKEYLDNLRESGETNMFGAGQYLQKEFGLEKAEAREVLKEWMSKF